MAIPINDKPPLIKQYWLRTLLFLIAHYFLLFLTAILVTIFFVAKGVPGTTELSELPKHPVLLRTILMADTVVALALVVLFRLLIDRRSLLSLGFTWKGFQREAAAGFLLGPALLGLGSLILFATGNVHWTDMVWDMNAFWINVGFMLLIAFSEETIFRGYVLNNLLEGMHRWLAWIITAMLFALIHAGNTGINGVAMINLFLGGLLLGLNYIFTKNLWFSIFFHFSWNFLQGPVLGYPVSGLGLQSVLQQETSNHLLVTGGPFGFEGSIINTGISIVAILLLYWVFERKYKVSPERSV